MIDERLGRFFWLSEFTDSDTAARAGIDNSPGAVELGNIRNHLAPGMERIRNLLGVPVQIRSGYRSPLVNAAVGGARSSQHMQGLAADFVAPEAGTPLGIALNLRDHSPDIHFDQLILEFGRWVHVSFSAHPRGEILTATKGPNGTVYAAGIV